MSRDMESNKTGNLKSNGNLFFNKAPGGLNLGGPLLGIGFGVTLVGSQKGAM